MLQRHEIRPGGRKIDRYWWSHVKFGMLVFGALGAAYVVHIMLV